MEYFTINTKIKVRLDAIKVKPELRGKSFWVKKLIGSRTPFHYLVSDAQEKEFVFSGDELQSVFAHDMEAIDLFKKIQGNII
jgi:hypothetical protein